MPDPAATPPGTPYAPAPGAPGIGSWVQGQVGTWSAPGGVAPHQHGASDFSPPLPSGISQPITLAYNEVLANQGSIVGTEVDITGLSATVTVPAGRRIRITSRTYWTSTVTTDEYLARIREGATQLEEDRKDCAPVAKVSHQILVLSPSAGTHTYRVTGQRIVGTGTLMMNGNANFPAYILVEDITGSSQPYAAASVPVGLLAQAIVTANQGGVSAETDLNGLSVNISVPAGRVLRITGYGIFQNTSASGRSVLTVNKDGTQAASADFTHPTANLNNPLLVSYIDSPAAGAHVYKLRLQGVTGTSTLVAGVTFPAYILVEDITATPASATGAPSSTLAYAPSTVAQSTITTEVDATGLVATVTVPAGRQLKLTARTEVAGSVAGVGAFLLIKEGTTELGRGAQIVDSARELTLEATAVVAPSAGTHTYKCTLQATGGNISVVSIGSSPAFLLVKDITGAVWPAGVPVTAGMVASEAWTDYVPTLTNMTLGNGTVVAKYSKIGRIVNVRFTFTLGSTSTMGTGPKFSLPVTAALADSHLIGECFMTDVVANIFTGFVQAQTSGTAALMRVSNASGTYLNFSDITATIPFTWANTFWLDAMLTYEAVS